MAQLLGVARSTIEGWFHPNATNDKSVNGCTPRPDARVKINPVHKPEIAKRVAGAAGVG